MSFYGGITGGINQTNKTLSSIITVSDGFVTISGGNINNVNSLDVNNLEVGNLIVDTQANFNNVTGNNAIYNNITSNVYNGNIGNIHLITSNIIHSGNANINNINANQAIINDLYLSNINVNNANVSGNVFLNNINSYSGSVNIFSDLYVYGNISYTYSNIVRYTDRNLELNYGGTNASAVGGGISVMGTSNAILGNIYLDSLNNWNLTNRIITPSANITNSNITLLNSNIIDVGNGTIDNLKSSNIQIGDTPFNLQTGTRFYVRNTSVIDSNINGSLSGNVYHQMAMGGRNWVYSQDVSNDNTLFFGCQGGGDPDPELEYYYKKAVGLQIQPNPSTITTDFNSALSVLGNVYISKELNSASNINASNINSSNIFSNNANIINIISNNANINNFISNTANITNISSSVSQNSKCLNDYTFSNRTVTYSSSTNFINASKIKANTITTNNLNIENGIKFINQNTFFKIHYDTQPTTGGNATFTIIGVFTQLPSTTVSVVITQTSMRPCWIYTQTYDTLTQTVTIVARAVDTTNSAVPNGTLINLIACGI